MARLKLKADPSFKAKVPIPIPGAKDPAHVEFHFKHRSRKDLNAFMEKAKEKDRKDIDLVMECATGWDLEDEFSRDSVEELLENYHGAARAIADTYYRELMGLRLGN